MIRDILSSLSNNVSNAIRNFDSNSTIFVDGFDEEDENAIRLNSQNDLPMYCVELSGTSNIISRISDTNLDFLHSNFQYKKDGFFIWVIHKKENFQKNYIFTHNKIMAEYFANIYNTELIEGISILNVLYDLQFENEYIINPIQKDIKRKLDMTEELDYDYVNYLYNNTVKDCVFENLKKLNVYQSTKFKKIEKKADLNALYSLDFEGSIYTYVSFNRETAIAGIEKKISNAKYAMTKEKEKLDVFKEEIKTGSTYAVTLNSVLFVKKETDNPSLNSNIGENLNMVFKREKEGRRSRKKLIKFSPLIERNNKWNQILPLRYLSGLVGSVHKQNSPDAHFFGKDINGAFINYNLTYTTLSKKNTRPHFTILGKTGSTKTTFANCMISQMIDYDWKTNKIGSMGVKLRQFDIKDSLGAFARHVSFHNKNKVDIIQTSLNEFSYNLLNIGYDDNGELDQNDIAFCKMTTSFIIYSRDNSETTGLTYDEDALYGEIIQKVYAGKKWERIVIEDLELYQKGLAQELYEKGYNENTQLHNIEGKEYEFLRKPTLSAIIKILDHMTTDRVIKTDPIRLKTVQSLRKKLQTIASLGEKTINGRQIAGYYNRYEKTNIDHSKPWLLFNMDEVKDLPDYAPIQWIMLNKMVLEDKKNQIRLRRLGKPTPLIIYMIEEAHNLFNNPLFKSTDDQQGLLDKAALEWRSYDIVLNPITQDIGHLPKGVLDSMETKILLFPAPSKDDTGESNEEIIGRIADTLKLSDSVKELLLKTPQYYACLINEHGAFILGFETTQYMRDVFDGKVNYK